MCVLLLYTRLLFIEISPDEHQLLSYFGLTKDILPQVSLFKLCRQYFPTLTPTDPFSLAALQVIVANMSDPDDLRRYHLSDYVETARPRTAQSRFEEATAGYVYC